MNVLTSVNGTACASASQSSITMLDLVSVVAEYATSDAELIATVVYLVNSGRVRPNGNFRGRRFDLAQLSATLAA